MSSKLGKWVLGRIHVSNGNREAKGAMETKGLVLADDTRLLMKLLPDDVTIRRSGLYN